MKKRLLCLLCLLLAACLLSGCSLLNMSTLEAMFRNNPAPSAANGTAGEDTVTISRAEYEKYKQFDELLELMDYADAYFYMEADHDKMITGASRGLLNELGDRYTFYYDPEEWQKLWEDDEGKYAGVGMQITASYVTGICTISRVFRDTPADRAGIQRNDILYKVEDLTVTAETLDEAVKIMRGTPGTDVHIVMIRDGDEIAFDVTRAEINVNYVESTMLTDDIGYIAFYEFSGEADKQFEEDLKHLTDQGAKGIILDLRDNGGGWTSIAVHIADLFMDEGEVFYTIDKNGYEDHSARTKDGKVDVKLVLLINENSASSSEILTGALKERADATTVGVKSFGKGIVQMVQDVGKNGAGFQMTIEQYMTPDGNKVHQIGITPDVEVPLDADDNGMYDFADTEKDPQLKKAVEVMKEKLK